MPGQHWVRRQVWAAVEVMLGYVQTPLAKGRTTVDPEAHSMNAAV